MTRSIPRQYAVPLVAALVVGTFTWASIPVRWAPEWEELVQKPGNQRALRRSQPPPSEGRNLLDEYFGQDVEKKPRRSPSGGTDLFELYPDLGKSKSDSGGQNLFELRPPEIDLCLEPAALIDWPDDARESGSDESVYGRLPDASDGAADLQARETIGDGLPDAIVHRVDLIPSREEIRPILQQICGHSHGGHGGRRGALPGLQPLPFSRCAP